MLHAKAFTKAVGNQLPPLVGPPAAAEAEPSHSTNRSIETLVVVLAVITLVGVIAGIIARLCTGRHDEEGWVERKCRSCIEAGVATAAAPLAKEEAPKPAAEMTSAMPRQFGFRFLELTEPQKDRSSPEIVCCIVISSTPHLHSSFEPY